MDLSSVPGFGPALTARVRLAFGAKMDAILRKEPYRLTEVAGIGWKLADAAALHLGVKPTDPRRQAAAALHVLREAEQEGHSALPLSAFGYRMGEALGGNIAGCDFDDDRVIVRDDLVSRRATFDAETRAAAIVATMRERPCPSGLPCVVTGLAEDQAAALAVIQRANIFCLMGSPGVGKTHLIKSLIASNPDAEISLCAPTGKAAKRIEESTGHPACTVHRLLEAGFDEFTGKFRFQRNSRNRLKSDLVVCDESSMLDIRLFASLVEALREDARLVLVGDPYQLPSVGPGRVLADLTRRGAVPNVELTQLKRHDPDLLIARNCAEIKAGAMPIVKNAEARDFFFIEVADEAAIANEVVGLAAERLPAKYGVDPNRGVIVLTALRERGLLSAKALNERLRAALNPSADGRYAVGDRVIQLKNDYKLDVMNGDIGTVAARGRGALLSVRFDTPERVVDEQLRAPLSLAHAWALTVWKAQGSEFSFVIIPVHKSLTRIQTRNYIYTAISRAKRMCILVGSRDELSAIISRVEEQYRCTRLADLLA